ncbi:MAG: hypothetical protein JSV96_12930 [Candidatus Aminicenantes bacterium]|nr:MAG: hypothetical protein JSV96_12930 [Candidatus Aminicenantes bacterium]
MKNKNAKKQYKKPEITQVKLEMDEAVFTPCKQTAVTVGKKNKNCGASACKKVLGS